MDNHMRAFSVNRSSGVEGLVRTLSTLFLLLVLSARSRDGDVAFDKSIKDDHPNNFTAYINTIASLASGFYVINANSDTPD